MTRSEKQVLITGCYRTGTEYFALLLGNHPEISVSMYIVSFLRFCYGRYDPIEERSNYNKLIFDVGERIRIRYNKKLSIYEILDYCDGCGEVNYAVLYDLIMCDLFLDGNVHQWAEKVQLVWTKIPAFLDMFPEGKAILVIRDPRSVLASFRNFTYAPSPAYLGAVFNCLDAMMYGRIYAKQYPLDRFMFARYEDFAADPAGIAQKTWQFLELEGTYDVRDQSGWMDAYGRPWRSNSVFQNSGDQKTFDINAAISRWETELNKAEVSLVEGVCGGVMEKFGYQRTKDSIDWLSTIRQFADDDTITNYFRHWLLTGEGIEAFPSDPLDPKNWRTPETNPPSEGK
jgi:hypothetical protein